MDWLKYCTVCKNYWCSNASTCNSVGCDCISSLTPDFIRSDKLIFTTCGACDKEIKSWLAKCETARVLTFKIKEVT